MQPQNVSQETAPFEYCDSTFARMADPAIGPLPELDLKNAIHPLFDRSLFPSLSLAEYNSLTLPLKLASRILDDDRTAEYIVGVTDGSLHAIYGNNQIGPEIPLHNLDMKTLSNHRLTRFSRTPVGAPTTQATRNRSRQILHRLVSTLTGFHIWDKDDTYTTINNIPYGPAARQWFPLSPEACEATVCIARSVVENFLQAPAGNEILMLACHHTFARTLVHELAHVLEIAVHGYGREAVFYGNSNCNEAGFEIEVLLFGGVYEFSNLEAWAEHSIKYERAEYVISEEYPNQNYISMYATGDLDEIMLRRPIDAFIRTSRIPFMFIADMFTERFWTVDVPQMQGGPIVSSEQCSWVVRYLKAGERYVDDNRNTVILTKNTVVPCNVRQLDLPAGRRADLQAIIDAQRQQT